MIDLFIIHVISYWSISLYYYILDIRHMRNNTWKTVKYKQIIKTEKELNDKTFRSVKFVIVNQMYTLLLILMTPDNWIEYFDSYIHYNVFQLICYNLIGIQLCNMWFYIIHRTLHINQLYKYVHYRHHLNIENVAVCALDAHPIEHILSTVVIFIIYCLCVKHFICRSVICVIMTVNTCRVHSNYIFKKNQHSIHHINRRKNYGQGLYLLDKVGMSYLQN